MSPFRSLLSIKEVHLCSHARVEDFVNVDEIEIFYFNSKSLPSCNVHILWRPGHKEIYYYASKAWQFIIEIDFPLPFMFKYWIRCISNESMLLKVLLKVPYYLVNLQNNGFHWETRKYILLYCPFMKDKMKECMGENPLNFCNNIKQGRYNLTISRVFSPQEKIN